MRPEQMKYVRVGGWVLVVVAVAMPLFLLIVAPRRAVVIALPESVLLLVFGILMLSGRWPASKR